MRPTSFEILRRGTLIHCLVVLLGTGLLSTVACGQADKISLKKGKPIIGKVIEEGDQEITYNIFRTGIGRVVRGKEKVAASKVKKVRRDPDLHRGFWRKAKALKDEGADQWVELGKEIKGEKLKGLAEYAFVEALVRDPAHEGARKELGGSRLKEVLAQDPRLNAELKKQLEAYLAIEDVAEREKTAKGLAELSGRKAWELERAYRSSKVKRGLTEDRLLTLDSEKHAGAVYTLLVPKSYDPFQPTPMVLGLHGGGAGGKDRTGVVGSGRSAMNFFRSTAERMGWIVVCPTALRAPWAHKENDEFVLAVVEEACMLLNIDRNRIYLAGHSMGGFGTWHFGPRYPHLWAAISPNAGGGRPSLKGLVDTKTGVYCYHGADDAVVGPGSDRALANQMLKRNMDFVYCEIPDSGHGWPNDVRAEMWEYFDVRRLAATRRRTEKGRFKVTESPLSSFAEKPSKAENRAFGKLFSNPNATPDAAQIKTLLSDLTAGGGRAKKAAKRLGQLKDPKVAKSVAKVLSNQRNNSDARRFAATALGMMGQDTVLKALRRAAKDESLDVAAASALSLGQLKDPQAHKSLKSAVTSLLAKFEDKKSGSRMDFTDFDAHLSCGRELANAIAASGDVRLAPSLHRLLDALLISPLNVPASQRSGQDPDRPRRALAKSILAACEVLGKEATQSSLKALASKSSLGVGDEARELLNA